MGRLRPREGDELPEVHGTSVQASRRCSRLQCSLRHERPEGLQLGGSAQVLPMAQSHLVSGGTRAKGIRCCCDRDVPWRGLSHFPRVALAVLNPAVTVASPAGKHPGTQAYARGPSRDSLEGPSGLPAASF